MNNEFAPKVFQREDKYYFVDIDGSTSQEFVKATVYTSGFALVKREKDKSYRFRDLLGRLSVNRTQSGKDFYEFCRGNLDFADLKNEYFADEKFYSMVKKIIINRTQPLADHFAKLCDIKRETALNAIADEENEK